MGDVVLDITMSIDGFVAGPNDGPVGGGLGEGGEVLHYWVFGGPWTYDEPREMAPVGVDKQLLDEAGSAGASVVGRRMYDITNGWGGNPPFDLPMVVVTHRVDDTPASTKFEFVTGIESAVAKAQKLAGDKRVYVGGGASIAQQALQAGLVDGINLHVAPVLLGAGRSLFGELGARLQLECTRAVESPYATHLSYRVVR
jgi:dihydrofolate reductase